MGYPRVRDEWLLVEKRPVQVHAKRLTRRVEIETREGTVVGEPGDFLMVGIEGEVYPCDPEIFDETHRVLEAAPRPETDELPEGL